MFRSLSCLPLLSLNGVFLVQKSEIQGEILILSQTSIFIMNIWKTGDPQFEFVHVVEYFAL